MNAFSDAGIETHIETNAAVAADKKPESCYQLYQSPISYYSAKVRSYLRYKQLPFIEHLSSDRIAKTVIKPATGGWRVIPVLQTPDGEMIQDSSVIIDRLEAAHPQRSVLPPGIKQRFVSALFELLGDEWLLFPAMHYRWAFKSDNLGHLLRTFGHTRKPHWPQSVQWLGGLAPALLFGSVAPLMLGINKNNRGPLQNWTEQILDHLDAHFAEHNYLLGGRPCYGDFALFGPIYAHLYLDPYPRQHLIEARTHLKAWVERMNASANEKDKTKQPNSAENLWCTNDEIPATLLPILQSQMQDQYPWLHELINRTQTWLVENPQAEKLPRFIGRHAYQITARVTSQSNHDGCAASGQRMTTPYSQWMVERALHHYRQGRDDERQDLSGWLRQHGLNAWLTLPVEESVVFSASRLWRQSA